MDKAQKLGAEYYTEYYVESYGSLQLEAAEVLNYKKLAPSRFQIICKNLHPGVFSSLVKTAPSSNKYCINQN